MGGPTAVGDHLSLNEKRIAKIVVFSFYNNTDQTHQARTPQENHPLINIGSVRNLRLMLHRLSHGWYSK